GKWGMHVTAVSSGADALPLLPKDPPFDLALLDLQMPEMDGLMLAEEIRKTHGPERLPLVMLTSIGRRDAAMTRLNFAAVLFKPVKHAQLLDAMLLNCASPGKE